MKTKHIIAFSLLLSGFLFAGAACDSASQIDEANSNTVAVDVDPVVESATPEASQDSDDETTNTEVEEQDEKDVETTLELPEEQDEKTTGTSPYSVKITVPEAGDFVESDTVVEAITSKFQIDPYHVEGVNVDGEGHMHLFVDGEFYSELLQSRTLVEGLPLGDHALSVTLNQNNHEDLDPAVSSVSVTVTVSESGSDPAEKEDLVETLEEELGE